MAEAQSRNLTNPAWAFSTLHVPHWPLRHALASKALATLSEASPVGFTRPAWSFAKL